MQKLLLQMQILHIPKVLLLILLILLLLYLYLHLNNKNELKDHLLEIINNQIYIERKIPSEKWQKQYDINMFENSYINMIK